MDASGISPPQLTKSFPPSSSCSRYSAMWLNSEPHGGKISWQSFLNNSSSNNNNYNRNPFSPGQGTNQRPPHFTVNLSISKGWNAKSTSKDFNSECIDGQNAAKHFVLCGNVSATPHRDQKFTLSLWAKDKERKKKKEKDRKKEKERRKHTS